MDLVITDISAFQLHRTPPFALRKLARGLPDASTRGGLRSLGGRSQLLPGIPAPVHTLASQRGHRRRSAAIVSHVISGNLPTGSIRRLSPGIAVTSPAATLLLMARRLSVTTVLMAACELCGTFSLYRLPISERQSAGGSPPPWTGSGWKPVPAADGTPSELWQRPPLLSANDLRNFIDGIGSARGANRLREVADHLRDGAASPLEVQAALLLGLPRRLGGAGLSMPAFNAEIPLDRRGRAIYRHRRCFADLSWPDEAGRPQPCIVECHSDLCHAGPGKAALDADRTTALRAMGFQVALLTYRQLTDMRGFETVARGLARLLGARVPETGLIRASEAQSLRRDLLVDWIRLGEQRR